MSYKTHSLQVIPQFVSNHYDFKRIFNELKTFLIDTSREKPD